MTWVRNSFVQNVVPFGREVVSEISHVTHPLVHAIEQPISNAYHETQTIMTRGGRASWILGTVYNMALYSAAAWLTWTLFGDIFPSEKRSLEYAFQRGVKRLRLQ